MVITIQLQSSDDLKFLEPLMKVLKKANLKVDVKSDLQNLELRKKAQDFLKFVEENPFITVNKISIPNREERNAR